MLAQPLPIHVSEVPEFEPRGDCLRIAWRGFEVFVPMPVIQAAMGRANVAVDQWYESKGVVLPFRPTSIAAE